MEEDFAEFLEIQSIHLKRSESWTDQKLYILFPGTLLEVKAEFLWTVVQMTVSISHFFVPFTTNRIILTFESKELRE
jgi:hypothetical protein